MGFFFSNYIYFLWDFFMGFFYGIFEKKSLFLRASFLQAVCVFSMICKCDKHLIIFA